MEFFRIKKDIPFMRHARVFNAISFATFLLAVFFIATRGLHLSVEFTGGTLVEVTYAEAQQLEPIRSALAADGNTDILVQHFGSARDVLIRLPNRDDVDSNGIADRVMATLHKMDTPAPELRRVEFVGPQVGKELASDGAMALLLVIIGIIVYLALRFEWRLGVATIVASIHGFIFATLAGGILRAFNASSTAVRSSSESSENSVVPSVNIINSGFCAIAAVIFDWSRTSVVSLTRSTYRPA